MSKLDGKKIAFLVANEGIEQIELTEPWKAVEEAGGTPELIAPDERRGAGVQPPGQGRYLRRSIARSRRPKPATTMALVMPGGVANPDALRLDSDAVSFTRDFFEAGKPVAAICHAPWTLIEADVVSGRKLTSWPSLQTDIRNAGGEWVDEEVVVDQGLVTSRKPDDLEAFCAKMVEEIAEGRHEDQREKTLTG